MPGKSVVLETENCASSDISNLLELSLSSMGYSKDRIIRYTFLVEEALLRWKETLPPESKLSVIRCDTPKTVRFSFIIAGEYQNPFKISPGNNTGFSMVNAMDRLMSGVGKELKYSYKNGINEVILSLPKTNIEENLLKRNVWFLMVPLTLQALMSSIASNVDTLMLGFLDASSMSGVSLASVFVTILIKLMTCISYGTSAMMVQFWGKRDRDGVNQTASLTMLFALISSSVFFVMSALFPTAIMSLYSNDPDIIISGAEYLRWLSPGLVLTAVYTMIFCYLQTLDNVKKTVLYSIIGCICNVLFNAVFIFGPLGISPLGVRGAALATDISALIQVVLGICELKRQENIRFRLRLKYTINVRAFFSYISSITVTGMTWIVAYNIINAAIGHMGKDIVSVNSLLLVLSGFVLSAKIGVGKSVGIIIGTRIGNNQLELAKEQSGYALKLCSRVAAVMTPIFLLAGYIMRFLPVDLSPAALKYLTPMLLAYGTHIFFSEMNGTLVSGILYSGGDSKAVLVIDTIVLWGVLVSLSLLAPRITFIPPVVIAMLLRTDEMLSFPMKYFRYRQYKWLRNITGT